jgi:hypothetical protein
MELHLNLAAAFLLFALMIKHVIAEGPLQENWIFAQKGKFLAPGGLVHVIEHGALSLIVLVVANIWFSFPLLLILGVVSAEVILHYVIDYIKANITKGMSEFTPEINQLTVNNRWFWSAFIVDQAAHHLTYVGMVYALTVLA